MNFYLLTIGTETFSFKHSGSIKDAKAAAVRIIKDDGMKASELKEIKPCTKQAHEDNGVFLARAGI